MEFLEVTKDR